MSTNKTPNLNLHSWVETDPVLMREFNENFNALDAAATRMVSGSYVGDGTTSKTLYFPFTPQFVLVSYNGNPGIYNSFFTINPRTVAYNYTPSNGCNIIVMEWSDSSLSWRNSNSTSLSKQSILNEEGWLCHYIAFGI